MIPALAMPRSISIRKVLGEMSSSRCSSTAASTSWGFRRMVASRNTGLDLQFACVGARGRQNPYARVGSAADRAAPDHPLSTDRIGLAYRPGQPVDHHARLEPGL